MDRIERCDLFHQPVRQFLSRADGKRRNVVDRLFGIQLGALPARLVEDIDEMAAKVEQTKLENREEPARARTDDYHVCFGCIDHVLKSPFLVT